MLCRVECGTTVACNVEIPLPGNIVAMKEIAEIEYGCHKCTLTKSKTIKNCTSVHVEKTDMS